MRFTCKVWPGGRHPAFPKEAFHWAPILNIRLAYQHSPPSNLFEAFVDSGAHACMFHANLCRSLGIRRVEDGIADRLGGVIGGAAGSVYFHEVRILVGTEQVQTMAGFSWDLSVGGILGRRGFFENFIVKIDSSGSPPLLELDKIHRA